MNNEVIEAYVKKIIFSNQTNNYYILATIYDDEELTITGNFINIEEDKEYEFTGDFFEHEKYGLQFKAIQANLILPTSRDMVIDFLSGSNFTGVGKKLAESIFEVYEDYEDILTDILENPEHLTAIKGMSQRKIEAVILGIKEHSDNNGLFTFLNKYQIEYSDVSNVFNKANLNVNEFINILETDPYLLLEKSISFKAIDRFASLLPLDDFPYLRAKGYVYASLKNECFKTGSTYLNKIDFMMLFINYQNYDIQSEFDTILAELSQEQLIVIDEDKIYEYKQYDNERFIADFVLELGKVKADQDIETYLSDYENYHGITFNERQKKAINNGINCPISIITGGPGTGKSTIVDALVTIIRKLDRRLLIGLAAPTGKASKRLTSLTSESSMTIHKMLKFDMHSNTFGHDLLNPLDYDVLIIDEASMIDNILMGSLLKAARNVKKIIFLGDYNQLPSVSQGQILKDLIESEALYVTYLNQIYRQKKGSTVIELAYKVLNREEITNDFFDDEVRLIDFSDDKEIRAVLDDYVAYNNKNEIQIMAPLYKGKLGIDNINKNIQRIIFGDNFEKYNRGDRVLQLKNRNDDEIYNGDVGIIDEITRNGMLVAFDHRVFEYNRVQTIDLTLAYCISIHKAQGNEYQKVIIFLPNYNLNFMDNKIFYTAITRTKSELIIISDLKTINTAINNIHNNKRETNLRNLIKEG